ncbi:2-oxoacid:acceptor oxidoreductase subunit alpha [Candidatus Fermentibacteria bacterium]|nr:2-oxoacid:acceptor oxidoreductase subunit alpha [Candidatus Fermentibacteria bacterium]
MACREMVVRIAGEAGEGVISTGELLTRAASRACFNLMTFKTFPAEVRGGHAVFQLRISCVSVLTQGDGLDLLVAMNLDSWQRHGNDLLPGATLVYDSSAYTPPADRTDLRMIGIPFQALARDELEFELGKNIVAVGAIAELLGLPTELLSAMITTKFAKKGDVVIQKNLSGLDLGVSYVRERLGGEEALKLAPSECTDRLMLANGNEAIALGAMAYGAKHFFGYPITPASEIMEFMALHLPKVGGAMVQAEDEIASLVMAIGASFAGVPAMTATSGPGLSLMSEALGLATMIEAPVVIIDVQRSGPSTGMPTKHEQSDLYIASFGGHGDAPRVVLAPLSVRDCFEQTIVAFNVAESLQLPVIVLSDQGMAVRTETIPRPALAEVTRHGRLLWDGIRTPFHRFEVTESGISPTAIPGTKGGEHVVSGLEQNEEGRPRYDGPTHIAMTAKRFRKLERVSDLVESAVMFGDQTADVGVLTWGSTAGSAMEATPALEHRGIKVAGMALRLLAPFPQADVLAFMNARRVVVIAEGNYQGQLASLVEGRQRAGIRVVRLTSVTGVPIGAGEIITAVEEAAR